MTNQRKTFSCSKGFHPSGRTMAACRSSGTWVACSTMGVDFVLLRMPLDKGWVVRGNLADSAAPTMQEAVSRFDRTLGYALGRMFVALAREVAS